MSGGDGARITWLPRPTPRPSVAVATWNQSHATSRDASGLYNEAVWKALERKGLARAAFPQVIALTPQGLAYETGVRREILHTGGH